MDLKQVGSWTRLFFIFWPIFGIHTWWFSKFSHHPWCAPLWKMIKYGKSLAEYEEKPVHLAFFQNPGFGYPIHHKLLLLHIIIIFVITYWKLTIFTSTPSLRTIPLTYMLFVYKICKQKAVHFSVTICSFAPWWSGLKMER